MLKKNIKILFGILLILLLSCAVIVIKTHRTYNLDESIENYDLKDEKKRNNYINFLKSYIRPKRLQSFVNNQYIALSIYEGHENGNVIIEQLRLNAIKRLLISMFNKSRTDFNDCPVTDNFKTKFNTNLIDYFNLYAGEDYNVNCSLDIDNKNFDIEIYGIEGYSENLEPNYSNTYNFHYTLDDEGNVNDIIQKTN